MGPAIDKDDPTAPEAAVGSTSPRSRMSPAALASAEEADRIPVGRRWPAAWTLLLVIAVPTMFWLLIAVLMSRR